MTDKKRNLDQVYDEFGSMGSWKENLYDWHGANEWIFLKVNSIHGELYDNAMQVISDLSDHEHFKYYFMIAALYALVSTVVKKFSGRGGVKIHMCKWFGVLLVLTAGYPAMGLTVKYVKSELAYERPYQKLDSKDVVWLEKQEKEKANKSFPSGHAAFIMFLLVAFWPVFSENMRWLGMVMALGVGWSRMALGVHFPADIVGGFIIAATITWLVRLCIYTVMAKILRIHC